jgi:hypothetical protein
VEVSFVKTLKAYFHTRKTYDMFKKKILSLTAIFIATATSVAQPGTGKPTPESTELWAPVPRVVHSGISYPNSSGTTAPSDAIILFDGKNFDHWLSAKDNTEAKWSIADGAMTAVKGVGDLRTKEEFENFQLHIEFRTPATIEGSGQGRGNSGIFMQGIYELQVLDSYENPTYTNGQAGSIYKQTMPLVNASSMPGTWQSFDIVYTAPIFNKDSMMLFPGYITVLHNGILIQNHTAIYGTTPNAGAPQQKVHGKGPVKLQNHNNPVSYRNIWIREL